MRTCADATNAATTTATTAASRVRPDPRQSGGNQRL
jgi:hypothetical protein